MSQRGYTEVGIRMHKQEVGPQLLTHCLFTIKNGCWISGRLIQGCQEPSLDLICLC